MVDTRLYVNSLLMKVSGDDTQFIVDLGNRYSFKRMVLNAVMISSNNFENFYDDYADFSYQYRIGAGAIQTVSVTCDQFIKQSEFLTWFNENNGSGGAFQLQTDPNAPASYTYHLSYSATNNTTLWRPNLNAKGWEKIGFKIPTTALPNSVNYLNTQTAIKTMDFTQSPTVLVRFDNIQNAHTSKYGQFTFQIENNANFGGAIQKVFQQVSSNQQLILPTEVTVNQLFITLLNCDMKKIKTVNGNNNDLEVIMNVSLFSD